MYTMNFSCLLSTLVSMVLVLSSSYITPTHPLNPESTTSVVLDVEGQEVQATRKYYILPAVQGSGNGGGLALWLRDGRCPFYVMQESREVSNGLPVRLLAMNKRQDVNISLSSDVNVVFHAAATICVQSTGWKVGGVDEITGRRYVQSGGLTGRPGVGTVSNWFKVDKYENGDGYKIVFCPSVCSFCKVVCGNVVVFSEDGKRWLGLGLSGDRDINPLIVTFKKA